MHGQHASYFEKEEMEKAFFFLLKRCLSASGYVVFFKVLSRSFDFFTLVCFDRCSGCLWWLLALEGLFMFILAFYFASKYF
jgi:hypothetical protein